MASGSFSASILSGHYTLRVDWTSTPNTATNTSSVVVTSYLVNDWSLQVGSRTVTNVVNGVTQTYSAAGITTTGTHSLGSVTQSVAHNSDGSKAITIQVTYPIKATIRDTYYSEIVATQSVTLDNIPRQSTISSVSPSNVTVGSSGGAVTVNIARNSSLFTHTVVWSFGSNSYTQTGQTTSATYTIPASWLAAIPSSPTGTGTVTVTTYNGSTQIGSAVSTTFTITAGVYPSIGSVTTAARGAAYTAGVTGYIAGYSTALVSASSVAGVNGSSISKYEFLQGGTVKATYSSSASSYSWTSGTLSGNTTFSVRVTDSRGRQTTKAATAISVSQYAVPAITANAFRSNSSGTADASGTYIRITASATATPSANSITALTYATKATTSSSWSAEANVGSGVTKSGFANTTSYDVRIKATDKLGGVAYKYFTIPTASYTMDFKVGGKGVAFGKVAETDNLVDSAWGIRSGGDVTATANLRIEATATSNPTLFFENEDGDRRQFLQYNKASRVARFVCYSQNSGTEEPLGYYEVYDLPATDQDRTGNASYKIITTKNISDIPDASASQRGLVSTGAQTFAGNKRFLERPTVSGSIRYPGIEYVSTDFSSFSDRIGMEYIDTGNATFGQMGDACWSVEVHGNDGSGGISPYRERYLLPFVTVGRTNNANYNILTSKSAVTVAQGGTGATNAAAARSNLGMTTVSLWSGTLSTTATTISNAYGAYSAYIIVGAPSGGSKASMVIPKAAVTTSDVAWQLTDNTNYRSFKIRYSGTSIIITGVAGSGSITNVYGIAGA